MRRVTLCCIALLFLAGWAAAQEDAQGSQLRLVVTAGSQKVACGDSLWLTCRLENTSDQPIRVTELSLERSSLTVDVTTGERTFRYTCIRPSVYEFAILGLDSVVLTAGNHLQSVLEVPLLLPGEVTLVAHYAATIPEVVADPVKVQVDPLPEGKQFLVVCQTNQGSFSMTLDPQAAPNTAAHFARLVRRGYYENLIFHRVIPGFMIQGGCPYSNGEGGPGFNIPAEFGAKHDEGTLAMARSADHDSAGSQFYVCLAPRPALDGKYTAFGKVVEGMETVHQIGDQPTTGPEGNPPDRPVEDAQIVRMYVEIR